MRRFFLAASFFFSFLASASFAQTTLVTGTVKDVNGVAYAGASMKAQLVLAGASVTGQPTVTVTGVQACRSSGFGSSPCQVPFQGTAGPFALDSTGSFSQTLQDNALVTPVGTQWLFNVTISPGVPPPLGTGPQACSATITITGASQSISASFSGCPALSAIGAGGGVPANLTYQNIITNASTQVRSGVGTLGQIQINNPGTGETITVFDNTSCSGTVIATISGTQLAGNPTLTYYTTFNTGLCVLTAGSQAPDISVGFATTVGTFNYTNIATNVNTQVKSAPGSLFLIQVNNPGTGWTVTVFDNTSCSGTKIATLSNLAVTGTQTFKYTSKFLTGLCVTSSGSQPGNITVASS